MTRDIRDSRGRDWRCYDEGRGGVGYGRVETGEIPDSSYGMVRCYSGPLSVMFAAPLGWEQTLTDDQLRERLERKLSENEASP